MKKLLMVCAALAFLAAPAIAQEATEKTEVAATAAQKIQINEDGSLSGKVFATVADEETPVDAKVTLLSSEGVVIESVQAENGAFAFSSIAPGAYALTGTATGFAGGQAYEVAPYASTGCSSCNLGLQSTDVVYQDSPIYDAPASACGSCGGGCSTCGSGLGGGFGGGGGGFGGGGLLGGRRLLRAGLIGGVVAIAVSNDDDDDASADQ